MVFTADEHVMLRDPSCVAGVLSRKNPEMMNTTAGVLKAHGFEEDSRFISGILPCVYFLMLYMDLELKYELTSSQEATLLVHVIQKNKQNNEYIIS